MEEALDRRLITDDDDEESQSRLNVGSSKW